MVYNISIGGIFMIKNIKQTDKGLIPAIQKYGCLFLCFAYASPLVFDGANGRQALNKIWNEATKKGYISGDLNNDGDVDDDGEAEILNHNALANEFFALDVKYDGQHHKADEKIPSKVKIVFGCYVWKGGHFVVLTKSKSIAFDSFGISNTVKNGKLDTMRFYF